MSDLFPSDQAHDVGGRSYRRMAPDTTAAALFGGPGDCYRYRLTRRWGDGRMVLWVMMNPSVASALLDDPTVAKCSSFARRWGYGGIMVANVFAYRCTDQRRLAEVEDPVGPDNDMHIQEMAEAVDLIVLAYGKPLLKRLRTRGPEVARMLVEAGHETHVIGRDRHELPQPHHPLYQPGVAKPARYYPSVVAA